jgi:hypothetical protein
VAQAVGHAAKRPLLHLSIPHLNDSPENIILPLENNALFLLSNICCSDLPLALKEKKDRIKNLALTMNRNYGAANSAKQEDKNAAASARRN